MSSKNGGSKFVSCFKLHGVPLLPPILSEEEKRECRLFRKEAMLLEKERELNKREQELERLKAVYECSSKPSSRHQDLPDDSDAWTLEFFCFMINAILRESSSIEDFKYIFSEVTKEFKEELRKRAYLKECKSSERSRSRNCDSTCHDVENLTLNQNQESCSSIGSIAHDSTCFERNSDNSLIVTTANSCHSERSHEHHGHPLNNEGNLPNKNIPVNNISREYHNISTPNGSYSNENCEYSPLETPIGVLSTGLDALENDGLRTPPKLIRSNSYTLESPSPSVLAYLRNLSVASSSEKIPSADPDLSRRSDSGSNTVVRNLNNHWNDNHAEQNTSSLTSPHNSDSLLHVANFLLEGDNNRNLSVYQVENLVWDVGTETTRNELSAIKEPLSAKNVNDPNEVQKLKAITIIQAAARGFLVRRLMKTHRVEIIKNTIKDAVLCAWTLYKEDAVTSSDLQLHERIIQQVTAACYELHSIFFKWSTAEKMALIKSDRERLKNPKPKFRPSRRNSESGSSNSSRSTSKSRSTLTKSETGMRKELKRPNTLPNIPKSNTPNFEQWSS